MNILQMKQDLVAYYHQRAKEYDKVYLNPEEQGDLLESAKIFEELFFQKTVLEIACGTGYWTERMAKTASLVWATDINENLIEIARNRMTSGNVTFEVADMYKLAPAEKFEGLFGGFIWSHILLQDLDDFVNKITNLVRPYGVIAFIDSKPVEGTHHDRKRITHTDEKGNTYQTRNLEDGTEHLVLKNFPTEALLRHRLSAVAMEMNYIDLKHYWIVTCQLKPASAIF